MAQYVRISSTLIATLNNIPVRVFAPLIKLHIQYRWLVVKLFFSFCSKQEKEEAKQRWLDNLSPVGQSPFDILIKRGAWAGALPSPLGTLHASLTIISCAAQDLTTRITTCILATHAIPRSSTVSASVLRWRCVRASSAMGVGWRSAVGALLATKIS
jgi:hypothetical protein